MQMKYTNVLEVPLSMGWKMLETHDITEQQNTHSGLLLYFESLKQSGSRITPIKIESNVNITKQHSYYTEASLIQKLEELGIGRPSTFSMLVSTIQERDYVKKLDIEGKTIIVNEYVLCDNVLEKNTKDKVYGQEKGKLVIQPIGVLTIEFLMTHFDKLFQYEYTKNMEEHLDEIATDENKAWYDICKSCNAEIKHLSKALTNLEKQTYPISDTDYEVAFQKYGAVLRRAMPDGSYEYKNIKKELNLDLDRLRQGMYTFDELIEIKTDYLGKYQEHDLYLRSGMYGAYVEWGEHKASVKAIQKELNEITLKDVIEFLERDSNPESSTSSLPSTTTTVALPQNKSILRVINTDISIRKGRYGAYVYYKTSEMKDPQFISLTKFKKGYMKCETSEIIEWLQKTHGI